MTLAAAAAAAAALAGCGSSSPALSTSADPASVIPATAALYAGATVRPDAPQSTEALAAAHTLTHQSDPYLRLLGALQTPGSRTLDFKTDVAPWLGPHAGVFLTSLSGAGPLATTLEQGLLGGSTTTGSSFPLSSGTAQGAIVLDTSNVSKAQAFLSTQAQHAGAHSSSYKGVSYEVTASGVAFGIVARFAVIGSEAGLHAVIDTSKGGPPLTQASGYSKLLAAAPSDALAHIYSNPASAQASKQPATAPEGLSGAMSLLSSGREANISLLASASSLALDADTLRSGSTTAGGLLSTDPESAQALAELPGESWLAIGLGHVGEGLSADVQSLHALGSLTSSLGGGSGVEAPATSTLSIKSLLEGMLAPLDVLGAPGMQAERAFRSWMGPAGIFASGASLLELKAAVVIESKNAALSRAAVGELGGQLRKAGGTLQSATIPGTEAAIGARLTGLPVVLDIAAGRDSAGHAKFVLGFGEASVTAALDPSSTLASAASRASATSSIGEGAQPSIIVDLPTLLTLLEGVGLTEDPSISKFVPYLRSIATLSGGGRQLSGEVQRFRVVIGLQ